MFDDGFANQNIIVRLDINTTIVHNTSNIRLKGAANVSGRSATDFIALTLRGGVWFELWRSW